MHNYFVSTLIPELKPGSPPGISIEAYLTLLKEHLSSSDLRKMEAARRCEGDSEFLKRYLEDERNIKLILVSLRAKKWGIKDPDDQNLEPSGEYEELKAIYESLSESPLELSEKLLEYRFKRIEALLGLQVFTIDRLMAYYFQLVLLGGKA